MTYELNTVDAATWLKEKTTMAGFLDNMGSTTDFIDQMYDVVIDWIPVVRGQGLGRSSDCPTYLTLHLPAYT